MSEERVSALEQTLRELSTMPLGYNTEEEGNAYKEAADLVHDRDAELWTLVDEWRQIARNTVDPSCAASYRACAANLVYRLTEKG